MGKTRDLFKKIRDTKGKGLRLLITVNCRKVTQWKDTNKRKLEIAREDFMQRWAQ